MAEWKELQTDQAWDPWVLGQLYATLAGWDNGEAVPIEALTIDDAARPAGRWRNVGGGGAGVWEDSGGGPIAEMYDDGVVVHKDFSGTNGSFSGAVSVAGHFSGSTGSFSGAVEVGGSLDVDGAATLGSTLSVAGNTTVGGTLGVTGAATFSSTASVTGNTTVGGTLGVTGLTTLTALTTTGNAILGDNSSDAITLNGTTTLGAPLLVASQYLGFGTTLPTLGALRLANNLGLYGRTTGGANARLLLLDNANLLNIGDATNGDAVEIFAKSTATISLTVGTNQQLRLSSAGAGFNGTAGTAPPTLPSAATDLPTAITLVNALRSMAQGNGLAN